MYEYLAHYGIKGQKWGVRRYQNSDGTLTAAGKKRYGGHEDDMTFEKGYTFVHTSVIKDIKMKDLPTYLSPANKNNTDTYLGPYAKYLAVTKKTNDVYAHALQSKKAILVPSDKKMREEFDRLMSKDKKFIDVAMKGIYETAKKRDSIKDNTPWEDFKKDKNRMFSLFTASYLDQHMMRRPVYTKQYALGMDFAKRYIKSLSKQKYNAILDYNDNGKYYAAEASLIILNGKRWLEKSDLGSIRISPRQAEERIKRLKDAGYTSNADVKHSELLST